jgi:hypothetical protein
VNSVEMLESADIGSKYVPLEPVDEERRIRRRMRLNAKTWSTKSSRALLPRIVRGSVLLAGGFCLGWTAFRFWHR